MDEEEARVLTKLADTVCKNVTSASQMLTILQSEETITDIDVQEIESRGPMYQQVKQLITILKTKRQNKKQVERGVKRPFEALCFALQTMGQHWLAEELATELKKASSNASNFEQPTFDIYTAVDEIISKYNGLSDDKKRRLNMPLDETLKRSLDESRKDICADLNMNELVNQYLHDLLSPDEVSDIKDARGSDKTQMFFIAVKKNIRRIITFMIGLKETHHEDRFHYFCTKEFCDKLVSVLDKP